MCKTILNWINLMGAMVALVANGANEWLTWHWMMTCGQTTLKASDRCGKNTESLNCSGNFNNGQKFHSVKSDWHNVRSYLFLNLAQYMDLVCTDLYSYIYWLSLCPKKARTCVWHLKRIWSEVKLKMDLLKIEGFYVISKKTFKEIDFVLPKI